MPKPYPRLFQKTFRVTMKQPTGQCLENMPNSEYAAINAWWGEFTPESNLAVLLVPPERVAEAEALLRNDPDVDIFE